jgi:putative 4-mercaptohistidine N1-methyltranferase
MDPSYETEAILQTYLLFHYGNPEEQLPWSFGPRDALFYPVRCVTDFTPGLPPIRRALDLGCAVGRSTFELTRFAEKVIGIDLSGRFIEAANQIRKQGTVTIQRVVEGSRTITYTHILDAGIDRNRCRFEVGDALNLRSDLGDFDFVMAANLLDRVSDPAKLLSVAARLTAPAGHCLLCSPYAWLAEYTPEAKWLGGRGEPGDDQSSWSALQTAMDSAFELIRVADLPFLISETIRKYQWTVAQASLWKRRAALKSGGSGFSGGS